MKPKTFSVTIKLHRSKIGIVAHEYSDSGTLRFHVHKSTHHEVLDFIEPFFPFLDEEIKHTRARLDKRLENNKLGIENIKQVGLDKTIVITDCDSYNHRKNIRDKNSEKHPDGHWRLTDEEIKMEFIKMISFIDHLKYTSRENLRTTLYKVRQHKRGRDYESLVKIQESIKIIDDLSNHLWEYYKSMEHKDQIFPQMIYI